MASSFTDQLRLDRNTFEDEVRKRITSNNFSEEDKADLALEAERLHLSQAVFEEIIQRVDLERKLNPEASPVLGKVSTELTLEDYRQQISTLRSLALSEHANALSDLINNESKTTQLEREIWKSLSA